MYRDAEKQNELVFTFGKVISLEIFMHNLTRNDCKYVIFLRITSGNLIGALKISRKG